MLAPPQTQDRATDDRVSTRLSSGALVVAESSVTLVQPLSWRPRGAIQTIAQFTNQQVEALEDHQFCLLTA